MRHNCIFLAIRKGSCFYFGKNASSVLAIPFELLEVVSQQLELCVFRCVAFAAHFFVLSEISSPTNPRRSDADVENIQMPDKKLTAKSDGRGREVPLSDRKMPAFTPCGKMQVYTFRTENRRGIPLFSTVMP